MMKKQLVLVMLVILLSASAVIAQEPFVTIKEGEYAGYEYDPVENAVFDPSGTYVEDTTVASAVASAYSTQISGTAQQTATQQTIPSDQKQITAEEARANYVASLREVKAAEAELDKAKERGDENEIAVAQSNYDDALARSHDDWEEFDQTQSFELGDVFLYYKQYSGMAAWTSIIWDDSKALQEWRDEVNNFFCNIGGVGLTKSCWTSHICGRYADIEPSPDGMLYSSAARGTPRAVAHIEGQRSLPIEGPDKTEWIYTITYSITNPHDEPMTFNIRFAGPKKTAFWWHEGHQTLLEGMSASAKGSQALMALSENNYHEVCITFDPAIRGIAGEEVDTLCNGIAQYAGGATAIYGATGEEEEEEVEEDDLPAGQAPGSTI